MKSSLMAEGLCFLASLSLACAALAGTPPPNKQRSASPESSNGGLSQNASILLSELHDNAYTVLELADQLQTYDRTPTLLVSYQPDAATLERMRNRINQMDRTLFRLRGMARSLPPEQRAEVDRIAPAMVELTDTTQTAIQFLNGHQDLLFLPQYATYLDEMYSEASRVERASGACPARAFAGARVNPYTGTQSTGSTS